MKEQVYTKGRADTQKDKLGKLSSPEKKINTDIQTLLSTEQMRLEEELGITNRKVIHASRPIERPFLKSQRSNTKVLFGGLTWKHEKLIQAVLEGLGYIASYLPTPTLKSFQIGREFCDNGLCNPAYFTIGNLIQYLLMLEEKGMSRREIIEKHVFFTAGACGPCRFGMYEAEYRLALRNAGFDGFRILILQQMAGMDQSNENAGLEMNLDFTLGIVNSIMLGDILNEVAYQIRPYEIVPGSTDSALESSVELAANVLRKKKLFGIANRIPIVRRMNSVITFGKYANVVFGFFLPKVIAQCREIFQNVSVDRTRIKPIVKITGEFWAQTTEGDGNYRMFQFLEQEGAHILPEPITTWLLYMLHQVTQSLRDRKYLDIPFKRNNPESLVLTIRSWYRYRKSNIRMSLAEILIKRQYNLLRRVMRDLPQSLGNQYELQEIAHPYFNSRIEGGEGHLEIAKNIKSNVGSISHMVLSVKPFGCMPSTQSDGVQSAVTSHFKDMIFLPIETSGEGELNAKSRVQMALNEARANAKTECAEVLKEYRMTYTDFQHHVRSNENLQNPFLSFPKQDDTVGIAANFATFVSSQMKMNRKDRGK